MGPTTKAHKGQYLTPLHDHYPSSPPSGCPALKSSYMWGQVLLPSRSSWRGWMEQQNNHTHACFLTLPLRMPKVGKKGENTPITSRGTQPRWRWTAPRSLPDQTWQWAWIVMRPLLKTTNIAQVIPLSS